MRTKKSRLIAVDGPAASGKGTLARRIADHYDFAYLDTGLLYRAIGYGVIKGHGDINNPTHALKAAAELSAKYINERHLPDKAIDVIDEAGANQRLQPVSKRKKTIGVADIELIVSKMARIPQQSVSSKIGRAHV